MKVIGKVDRTNTIEEVMKARPRTGADYLDLRTGQLVTEITGEDEIESETVTENEEKWTKEELEEMKMSELREIGKPLGARDTKKSELINEILKKQ